MAIDKKSRKYKKPSDIWARVIKSRNTDTYIPPLHFDINMIKFTI